MKIKFVGAVGKVTGSCTWCVNERTATQFLVDCGAVQGMHQEAENNMPFPFDPSRLKFVLLTHAHMDHCGRIPQLYAQGFRGKVICTSATADLALLQLQDSHHSVLKREKHEAEKSKGKSGKNRRQASKVNLPPYPRRDWFYPIDKRRGNFAFKVPMTIDDDLRVSFMRSSHMLGGCAISVMWDPHNFRKSICFSGDVGPNFEGNCYQTLMKKNQVPHWNTSYLVVESTYGGKGPRGDEFKDFANRMSALTQLVTEEHDTVVLPCFSMQRSQEVLADAWRVLQQRGNEQSREWEIILDSPLASRACQVFLRELLRNKNYGKEGGMYLNEELESGGCGGSVRSVVLGALGGGEDSEWVSFPKPKGDEDEEGADNAAFDASDGKKRIIITSSGMCHAGPVLSHLSRLEDDRTAFVITGFQNTFNGRQLNEVAKKQDEGEWDWENGEEVFLLTDEHEECRGTFCIRARVFNYAAYYSGHADIDGLLRYILEFGKPIEREMPPTTVFLNHGDNLSRQKLRDNIFARSCALDEKKFVHRKIFSVEIPQMGSPFFDLERGTWE